MLNFIKGLIIGVGKIIPGVSGSLIAISFGIYERLINDIPNLLHLNKKEYKFLLQIGFGVIVSIICFSKIILFLLNKFYFYTMFLLLGLIIGGSIPIYIKMKEKTNIKLIIILIIPIVLLYIGSYLNINLNLNFYNIFFIGILEAISIIIPGVSGTALFMSLGIYEELLLIISSLNNIPLLLLFYFGTGVGIILLSNILNYLIQTKEYEFCYLVFSMTLISILIMIKKTLYFTYTFKMLLIGIILFLLGYYISRKL